MSGSYPNMLASGLTSEATFVPFELWAGEADLTTSQGTAAVDMVQFQVIARDVTGNIVPWPGHQAAGATGTVTFGAAPSAGDSVTINGVAIGFVTSGPTGNQIVVAGSATAQATALAAFVNGLDEEAVLGVTATSAAGVVTLTTEEGADTTVTLAKSGTNITVSGAATTGGSRGQKAIGFLAQAAAAGGPAAYYVGGVPNHLALVWPSSVSTLNQRKAAFDGTKITIGSLL